VSFQAEPTWGWVPFDVDFSATSKMDVTSWAWDLGDGDSAFVQNPTHTYKDRGMYSVTCEIDAAGDVRSFRRDDYVIALADTVTGDTCYGMPGAIVCLSVSGTNTAPVRYLTIPVECVGDFSVYLDSFSTVGCRTEHMDVQTVINLDPFNARFTLELSSSPGVEYLSPGSGMLAKFFFTVPGGCSEGEEASMILDGYNLYEPHFYSSAIDYCAKSQPGLVKVGAPCCEGMRGNINDDPLETIDISDLTMMVAYMFKNGPDVPCLEEANVNGVGGEQVDIADLTYLVAYMFKDGPPPVSCP